LAIVGAAALSPSAIARGAAAACEARRGAAADSCTLPLAKPDPRATCHGARQQQSTAAGHAAAGQHGKRPWSRRTASRYEQWMRHTRARAHLRQRSRHARHRERHGAAVWMPRQWWWQRAKKPCGTRVFWPPHFKSHARQLLLLLSSAAAHSLPYSAQLWRVARDGERSLLWVWRPCAWCIGAHRSSQNGRRGRGSRGAGERHGRAVLRQRRLVREDERGREGGCAEHDA